jgi:NAD+ kinase
VAATVPLLGINRGRLGFLADISPADMLAAVDRVLAGDFEREERRLLQAEIISERGAAQGMALNDVVVKRLDSGRMFEFQTLVDGVYVNTHGGDGLIVATPTGSTAYALSCGGPILTPQLDALVLAPICPHTLSDRPIVIPGNSRAEIRLREQDEDAAAVCCDGDVIGQIGAGDSLRVSASSERLQLIHPPGYDFYEILRGKLNWGRSNRQSQRPG